MISMDYSHEPLPLPLLQNFLFLIVVIIGVSANRAPRQITWAFRNDCRVNNALSFPHQNTCHLPSFR